MADHDGITLVEEWRPIKGYEGCYEISNCGRVRSLDRVVPHAFAGHITKKGRIKPINVILGYNTVNLYRGGKGRTCRVARLMGLAFGIIQENEEIDHRNRQSTDDSFTNLRAATGSQNKCNRGISKRNTSGVVGVCWDTSRNKWLAWINKDKKCYRLGRFKKRKDAIAARRAAEIKYHGEFAASA